MPGDVSVSLGGIREFKSNEANRFAMVALGQVSLAVHQLKRYKKKAFERLTSERGLFHRSKRSVEPEAVFGQIKTDKQYKRFRHRGFSKIQMDFGILAMAFNLQKLIKNVGKDQIKAVMEAFSTLFGPLLASLWPLWGKFQKEETSVNKNRQLSNRNLVAA